MSWNDRYKPSNLWSPLRRPMDSCRKRDRRTSGVIIWVVSGGFQSQNMGLFPFRVPLRVVTLVMVKQCSQCIGSCLLCNTGMCQNNILDLPNPKNGTLERHKPLSDSQVTPNWFGDLDP